MSIFNARRWGIISLEKLTPEVSVPGELDKLAAAGGIDTGR
jgi:hypothetical protein